MELYETLPRPLVSRVGFQGCFASFETNGELLDPVQHALVPGDLVEEGCEGELCCASFRLHLVRNDGVMGVCWNPSDGHVFESKRC